MATWVSDPFRKAATSGRSSSLRLRRRGEFGAPQVEHLGLVQRQILRTRLGGGICPQLRAVCTASTASTWLTWAKVMVARWQRQALPPWSAPRARPSGCATRPADWIVPTGPPQRPLGHGRHRLVLTVHQRPAVHLGQCSEGTEQLGGGEPGHAVGGAGEQLEEDDTGMPQLGDAGDVLGPDVGGQPVVDVRPPGQICPFCRKVRASAPGGRGCARPRSSPADRCRPRPGGEVLPLGWSRVHEMDVGVHHPGRTKGRGGVHHPAATLGPPDRGDHPIFAVRSAVTTPSGVTSEPLLDGELGGHRAEQHLERVGLFHHGKGVGDVVEGECRSRSAPG